MSPCHHSAIKYLIELKIRQTMTSPVISVTPTASNKNCSQNSLTKQCLNTVEISKIYFLNGPKDSIKKKLVTMPKTMCTS